METILRPTGEAKIQQISNLYQGRKIAFLVADNSACGYYRAINPGKMLEAHGAEVVISSWHDLNILYQMDDILAPRQTNVEIYETLRMVQQDGKRIWYEVDDDLDSVLPTSPAFFTYHYGSDENRMIPKFIKFCDGFITTTPEIAKWYGQYNTNYSIIENFIDFSLRDWNTEVIWEDINPTFKPKPIPRPSEWEGHIVIEYSFGSTHREDLAILGGPMKRILEKNKNVLLALYSSSQLIDDFIRDFGLPSDKIIKISPRHFLDFPQGLFGADIGLAPLIPCQFNLAKSFLKVEEGLSAGQAVVASHVGPYAKFARRHPESILSIGQGKGCFRTWEEAIQYLIDNPDKRKELQIKGRQLIYDEYSLERNFHLYPMALDAMTQRLLKGEAGPPSNKKDKSFYRSYGKAGRNDPCPCNSGLSYKKCCLGAF